MDYPGIVAGGDGVRTMVQGPIQQGTEFDLPIAVDTGIWRASMDILRHKFVHDLPLEQMA